MSAKPDEEPSSSLQSFLKRIFVQGRTTLGVTLLCVLAGSTVGLLIVPRAPSPDDPEAPLPVVSLLGRELKLDEAAAKEASKRAQAFTERTFSLVLSSDKTVTLPLSKWGAIVDEERLEMMVADLRDPGSPLRRSLPPDVSETRASEKSDRSESAPGLQLPVPVYLSQSAASAELLKLKGQFDRAPKDARLNFAQGGIIPEVTGRWLDLDQTRFNMDAALLKGELRAEAAVRQEKPERTAAQLEKLKFDTVLGHFETQYSRADKVKDRTYNLRLAANALDGTVLLPGEVFDFNKIVGARDEANGYKVATVIADGELVDGIGGGTCQISGTLHGAVFFAGLDIVERYPHTRPSSYIKMGMDATVVYPTINFRFKNPYDFPIALHQTVEGGVVHAEVRGPAIDQVVTLIRKVDQAIPYEQLERKDPRLPSGTRVLAQRGVPGFRLHRYRTIRRGSHTTRERWRDIYPPTTQVIRIGTGEATLEKPAPGSPPEYTADEVLILTMRRPETGKPAEFAENRTQGKYGTKGWTKEAGMPFWEKE